jgi:hypothetical protein
MNRFFIRNRIQDYLDNNLSPAERSDFENGIVHHPDLQQELDDLIKQQSLLLEYGSHTAPDHLAEQILSSIDGLPATRVTSANNNHWFFLSTVAIAALLFLIIPNRAENQMEPPKNVNNASVFPLPNDIVLPKRTVLEIKPQNVEKQSSRGSKKVPEKATTNTQKTNPKVVFRIDTPDQPYVADWEGEVIELNSSTKAEYEAYQIRHAEENALFVLAQIATVSGGSLLTLKGKAVEPSLLTYENGFRKLNIVVPIENLNLVDQKLRQLGAVYRQQSVTSTNGQAIFPVEVTYKFY